MAPASTVAIWVPPMTFWFDRVRLAVSPAAWRDRRNIRAGVAKLQLPESDAGWLYRRTRMVGCPRALADFQR